MQYVALIFLIGVLFVRKPKTLTDITCMFSVMWILIITISSLGVYGMKIPRQEDYFLIFMGVVCFCVGTMVNRRIVFRSVKYEKQYCINYKLIYVFAILAILVVLPDVVISVSYLLRGFKLGHLHSLYFAENSVYGVGASTWLYYVLVYPVQITICIFAAYDFFFGKRKIVLMVLAVLLVMFRLLQFGGRASLFFFCVIFFISYILSNKKNKRIFEKIKPKKGKGKIFMILIVVVVIATIVSRLSSGFSGVAKMLVEYSSACISIMSENMQNDTFDMYTFGLTSFMGFYKYINTFMSAMFSIIGLVINDPIYEYVNSIIVSFEQPVNIGLWESNSFVTAFYYFFKDAGILGVSVGSFIWGMFSKSAYIGMRQRFTLKSYYYYMLAMLLIVFSMMRFWLGSPEFAISFFSFFLFVKREQEAK